MKIKLKRLTNHSNNAVTELVGTILLLGAAITIFSILYLSMLTFDFSENSPKADLLASLDPDNNVVIEHWGEESIDVNSSLLIDIAGERFSVQSIKDYIPYHMTESSKWNFGEKIIFPLSINVTELHIEAHIADIDSNALVVMSTLQEGYIVPPFGRGGIWHFDENAGSTAYDSSGNMNHGVVSNASWNSSGRNASALDFNGFQSLVTVPRHPSLDIYNAISMEAWVKPFDFDIIISQGVLENKFAYTPDFIHVNGDLHAVVSETQGWVGTLSTLNITDQGEINFSSNTWNFGNGKSKVTMNPKIRSVSNDMFVIAYIEDNDQVVLKTVNITINASINPTGFSLSFDADCFDPYLVRVDNDTFAVIYGSNNDGIIRIINISSNGDIIDTGVSSLFSNIDWVQPRLYHIDNDLFALSYTSSNIAYITTVNITGNASLDVSSIPDVTINATGGYDPFLIHMGQGLCVVLYGNNDNGFAKSVHIYQNGTIEDTSYEIQISSLDFFAPHGLKTSDNGINGIFTTINKPETSQNSEGYLFSLIVNASNAPELVSGPFQFESDKCSSPQFIQISDNVYGVIYTHFNHKGMIKTIFLDPTPEFLYMRVLGKYGSYGFNINTSTVFALINGERFSAPIDHIASDNGWYHVVVTYDAYNVQAYVNLQLALNETIPGSPQLIQRSLSPLLFGRQFLGVIDEVAVFDRVLTTEEIVNHYNNPGDLYS